MEREKIKELKQAGFDPVYVWNAEPNEEDPDHTHPFDTHIVILSGSMLVRLDNQETELQEGDETVIPREKVHCAKVGSRGCKYIVAEKH